MKLIGLIILLAVVGCSTNPHKAERIESGIDKGDSYRSDTSVGVKDGNMVVQKKVMMSEELRRLENDVYGLEDRVYGNRKYGSKGLYGVLKDCRTKLSDKNNGGDGKLTWTEPIDRVADKEESMKMGLDDKDKIIGLSEEFLKDRIDRFITYKNVLEKRQDEYEEKIAICNMEFNSRKVEKTNQ